MEINYDKFETPIPVGQKENRVSEAQKSPENAPEVSRSCQNFPRPAFFKVPFYTRINIQNNLLVLETLPPVVLGHFLSFLKEKRWNKYNQPFVSCHATLLPKGTAAHTRTTFLISLFETRWDNVQPKVAHSRPMSRGSAWEGLGTKLRYLYSPDLTTDRTGLKMADTHNFPAFIIPDPLTLYIKSRFFLKSTGESWKEQNSAWDRYG